MTGSPAAGKTRLIAELMADDAFAAHFHAFVPLRGMTVASATWALAEQLSLPGETPEALLAVLAADARRTTIVAPSLDESGIRCDGAEAGGIVESLLQPLTELPHVRLLAEARPEYLTTFSARADLVNLDDPRYTDRAAFAEWLRRTAAAIRVDPRLAAAAARYHPNAGLAELALRAGPGGDVVGRWLRLVHPQAWPAVEALASAYEELDADTWYGWTSALTGDPQRARAAVTAVMPLVQRTGDGHLLGCRPVAEAIRRARTPQATAHIDRALGAGMYASVPESGGRPDWSRASGYVLRHLARHAVEAGVAPQLLADPGFLVHGEPIVVTGALETVPGPATDAWLTVGTGLLSANSPAERASVLRLGALLLPDGALADRLARFARHATWVPAWASALPDGPGSGTVSSLALGTDADVLHGATVDGPVHTISTEDGSVLDRTSANAGTVRGLVPLPDGTLLHLGSSGDLGLLGPDTARHDALLARLPGSAPPTALGADPTASTIVLGDRSGALRAVQPGTDAPADECATPFGAIRAVTCLTTPGARLAVFAGSDGAVRMWTIGADLLDQPAVRRPTAVSAVTSALLPDGPAFAAAWADGWIWFWRSAGEDMLLSPLGLPVRTLALRPDGTLYAAGPFGITALHPGNPASAN
ncbi:WD40 repeat domain-containing protein [Actinomadura sediminis]|uniref:WD40 repeat domain-containing protein n=1 Tax=Actinomadura sediminis TaxID=1038904 RepID=A0ABW3EYA3_9ACTN